MSIPMARRESIVRPLANMSLDASFNSTREPIDRASKLVGGLRGASLTKDEGARDVNTNGTPRPRT